MKRFLPLFLLLMPFLVAAQLSGTKKIGVPLGTGCSGACDYASLTLPTGAFAAVMAQGINGNVIFEIYTDLSESGASVLGQFTDMSGPHTITIRPSGPTMRVLSGSNAGDGLIPILGGDRVIIDGRDPADPTMSYLNRYLTIRNTSLLGPAINLGNDAVSCSIRSTIIESRNATGTAVLNVGGGGISGNDDLTIDFCDIKNDATDLVNLPQIGINMAGGASQSNDNIQITNNHILNFFLPITGGTGIKVGNFNSAVSITGNSIYQEAARTSTVNIAYSAISINSAAGSAFRILGNYIGGSAPNAGGSLSTVSATGSRHVKATLIDIAETSFSAVSFVSGNTIKNFATESTASAGAADGGLAGISISRGFIDVRDNFIGGNTPGEGLTVNYDATSNASAGMISGISYVTNTSGTGLQGEIEGNFINNLIANNTGATPSAATEVAGIFIDQQTGTNPLIVKNNLIGQLSGSPLMTTNNNATNAQNVVGIDVSRASVFITLDRNKIGFISSQGSASSSYARGISSSSAATLSIVTNQIFSITSSAVNTNLSGAAVGIYASNSSSPGLSISKNTVHDIINSNTVTVAGVLIGNMAMAVNPRVENNMITLGNGQTSDTRYYGIYSNVDISAGTVQVYANSVVITGPGNGGNTSRTSGFYRESNTVFDLRANLCLNNRAGGGTHYALGTTTFGGGTSDFNLLYSSTPGTVVFLAGTSYSFTGWQGLGQDANSKNDDLATIASAPNGKFISIANGNLRIPDDGSALIIANIIDQGSPLGDNPVDDDVDKAHRTNLTDIGASEVLVTWLGVTSTDWNTATNWSGGLIPSCAARNLIKIGPGVPNQPNISVSASFRELVILDGAAVTLSGLGSLDQCPIGVSPYSLIVNGTLQLEPAGTQEITLYGDFYQNNIFSPEAGTLNLVASSAQFIDGDDDPIELFNLNISGGGEKTLNQQVKISGTLDLTDNGLLTTSTANVFTFTSSGNYTGGSSTSYINGPASKETTFTSPPFYFPIGNGGKFRPAAIEPSNTTATTFTAQYFFQSAVDNIGTDMESSLTNVSDVEYWKIDRSSLGSASGYIHLTWDHDSGISASQADRDLLAVVRWDGSKWVNSYQIANSGTQLAGEVTSGYVFVYNTYFTLGSSTTNNPLPVELLNFSAVASGSRVKLAWETATELNNDYFAVEISESGHKFEQLAVVKGHGTTSVHQYYSTWDFRSSQGFYYYRLKQVDFDGKIEYSRVVKVEINENQLASILVSPNPVTSHNLQMTMNAFGEGQLLKIEIIDLAGRKIREFELESNTFGITEISVDQALPDGLYIVKATSSNQSVQTKIVVRQ